MINCEECNKEIERHVFCSRTCNNAFYNKQRYYASEKKSNASIETKPLQIKRQVLNCKKHHGSSSCGCTE